MALKTSAADFLPQRMNLTSLREAADACKGCELYKNAAQTVFGMGQRSARVMLVGEAPGDEEDQRGEPFVGPAGSLLRGAMREAGLSSADVYLTNAAKHFRWETKGKHRIHVKPSARHVRACRPWLEAEIEVVKPSILVCLGATAAKALLGSDFRVTKQRGAILKSRWAPQLIATYHPSAILRAPNELDRRRKHQELVDDLHLAAESLSTANN